jgi:ubiE/COQ5 methyltransferase family
VSSGKAAAFAGTLAEFYDRFLVPLIFAPYAEVVADRVKGLRPRRLLETAAGTGIVTEALARILPSEVTITATDLNQAMIDLGKARPRMERVSWIAAERIGELLGRDPHALLSQGYFDEPTIRADLATARFRDVSIDRIGRPATAASARDAAEITVQGSLLRTAIEAADPSRLGEATKAVEQVMSARFGEGPVEGETKALIVTATKPQSTITRPDL